MSDTWDEFIYWSFRLPTAYSSEFPLDAYLTGFWRRVVAMMDNNPTLWALVGISCLRLPLVSRREGAYVVGFLVA